MCDEGGKCGSERELGAEVGGGLDAVHVADDNVTIVVGGIVVVVGRSGATMVLSTGGGVVH